MAQRAKAIDDAAVHVQTTLDMLERDGLACEIAAGAGTGTFRMEGRSGLWNELQVGSYVFMDTEYARIGGTEGNRYTEFRHSLFVLASVMSRPAPDRAVVDAGLKSYSVRRPAWVHGRDDVEVVGMSDEHGKLRLGPAAAPLGLGDKVMLIQGIAIPPSTCTTGMSSCRAGASWRCGRSPPAA